MAVPTPPRRLLLIGWAGADWRLIQPLVDAGRMPHLESLITQGISGKIVTQAPMVPPALWTSIATGRRADAHGILGHTMPDFDGLGLRPVTSVDLRAAPVWQILNAEGRSAAAVGWPVTHPATVFDRLVVSDAFAEARGADFDTWPVLAHAVSDPKLVEALTDVRLHPSEVTAEQVLPFIPQAGRIDQETDHRLPLLAATLARATTIHGAATWIVEHQTWDLLAVHFDLIERLSTAFLQYRAPRMPHVTTADFEIYRDVVDGAYQFMDLLLGRYLSLVGRDTHVLLISDHGFQIDHLRPPPNALLVGDPVARRYRELGVLVCRGPGVKKDELVFGATLLDVAPTALALLGVPASREMEGRVLAQIFEESGTPASVDRHAAPVFGDRARDWEDRDWAVGRIIELVALGYLPPVAADPSAAGNQAIVQRLSNLARVLMAKREHRQALTVLGDVLDLDPERLEARFEVFRCWYALDDVSRCREALDDIAASGVRGPAVDFLRGQLCAKEGNLEAAAIHLESAEQASVGDWRLLEQIGRVHLNARQWVKAEQSFRNALDIDPNFAQAHSGLGTALNNQQRHEEAIDHLRRSIGLLFLQPDAHVILGLSLAAVGRSPEAADAMRQALVIQPDFPQARVALNRIEDVMAKRMIEAVMKTV